MSKGKGFFDGEFAAPEGKTPVEKGTIRGVKFVDSPREEEEVEERDPHSVVYIPSEAEWKGLKREIRFQAHAISLAIIIGTAAFILAIRALVTK